MMAGIVVIIGNETTIERLSEATNQPIWAQAQIAPDRKAGTTTGMNFVTERPMDRPADS